MWLHLPSTTLHHSYGSLIDEHNCRLSSTADYDSLLGSSSVCG